MKYKEIEKIPYITAIIPEGYKYAAMAAVMNVGGKDTLIVELYDGGPVPKIRVCIDDVRYATYIVADSKWVNSLIYDWSYSKVVGINEHTHNVDQNIHAGNMRIEYEKFIHEKPDKSDTVLGMIKKLEGKLHDKKCRQSAKNKTAHISASMEKIPPLSDGFKKFVQRRMGDNYMFYLRKHNIAFLTCTKCGNRDKYYTDMPERIEDYAKSYIETPAKGKRCTCRFCKADADYMQEGRYRGPWTDTSEFYNITALENDMCLIQLVNVKKTYALGEAEEWEYSVRANVIYSPGARRSEKFYYRPNSKSFSTANAKQYSDEYVNFHNTDVRHIYNIEALSSTCLRYSGIREYYKGKGKESIVRYADTYIRFPEMELLVKKGLVLLAEETIKKRKTQMKPGKTVFERLGIRQSRVAQLVEAKGDSELLELFRLETATGQQWADELIPDIRKLGFIELSYALRYMTAAKYVKYITENGKGQQNRYYDYLRMKVAAGYDMTDSIVLFPKDLAESHARITLEINEKKNKERMIKKNEEFPEIEQSYQKLCRKYEYKKDGYIIRPASSAAEIIREGTALHHCVGASDTYMSRHAKGTSYILLLRKVSAPDVPYCTVEIAGNRIKQWYQAYDNKPDAKDIQPWLDKYLSTSKLRALGSR